MLFKINDHVIDFVLTVAHAKMYFFMKSASRPSNKGIVQTSRTVLVLKCAHSIRLFLLKQEIGKYVILYTNPDLICIIQI